MIYMISIIIFLTIGWTFGIDNDCVVCDLQCPYGLKTVNNIKFCECYLPCEPNPCTGNTICEPYLEYCIKPPCVWRARCIPNIPYSSCTCNGDPHCYTFDNAGEWDNQITCEYIAAMSSSSTVPPFIIYSKNLKFDPAQYWAVVEYIKIVYANDIIILNSDVNGGAKASVNGQFVNPTYTANPEYTISGHSSELVFKSLNGIKVTYRQYYFRIELSYAYFNLTKGWCGNFDGISANDKYDKNNYAVDIPNWDNMHYLAESWVSDPLLYNTSACKASGNSLTDCKIPTSICDYIGKSPFVHCTASLNIKELKRACIYDILQTCNENSGCIYLSGLASTCARKGFLFNWRKITKCPCNCADPNAECIDTASSPCVPTCSNMKGICLYNETGQIVEECICKPGFYLFGGMCVSEKDCGCVDNNGVLRELNEKWKSLDCKITYTCNSNNRITLIQNQECPNNTICSKGICRECRLICPYGLKTVNNQRICECFSPCNNFICSRLTVCEPYQPECKFGPCTWLAKCVRKINV